MTLNTPHRASVAARAKQFAAGAAICATCFFAFDADSQTNFVHDGKMGFVVSNIEYAQWGEGGPNGSCPNGLTRGYANVGDVLPNRPELQRRPEETDAQYGGRAAGQLFGDMSNLCMRPETASADENWRTVAPSFPIVGGIDLDGQVSRATGRAAPGTCAHDDFRGENGDRGVDNQFFRVSGCTPGFQNSGQGSGLTTEMLTGTWGILISVTGVDDARNDDDVEVHFYANADRIELSPTRDALANATYSANSDPRFRATARGRIVNGVLTTEPADVRFPAVYDTVRTERPLRDARLRVAITADGGLDGYLAGYTPVEAMYDVQYGFRTGTELSGEPAPPQLLNTRAIGTALAAEYTCHAVYHALHQYADGHRDPATGRCTSISTQYRVRAASAFVVD